MKREHKTREEWLGAACASMLKTIFAPHHNTVPKYRISVGWPRRARAGKGVAIGQCWGQKMSKDSSYELFISPALDEPVRVLDVAAHELVHACVGVEEGHKGKFSTLARAIGLEGKLTATVAGEALREKLAQLADSLGPYPHAALRDIAIKAGTRKTFLKKVACPDCGYTIRVTEKWIALGLPTCPCGAQMVTAK